MIDLERLKASTDLAALVEAETGEEIRRGMVRCPFHEERTPSLSVRPEHGKWKCFGCGKGGDVIDFVRELRGLTLPEAVAYLSDGSAALATPRPPRPKSAPRDYPPQGGVLDLWDAASEVTRDAEACGWLRGRGLDPGLVSPAVARVLRPGSPCPSWAALGRRPWSESHRLVFGLFDAAGSLRSLKARDLTGSSKVKEASASGCASAGLVYASPSGQFLLARPEAFVPSRTKVAIGEGGPDHLALCAAAPDYAVLSIPGSGGWSKAIAERIPSGARVVIATDPDPAGDAYADEIANHLRGRCDVRRARDKGRS